MPKIKVRPVDQISRKPVSYAFAAFMRHCQLKNLAPYVGLIYLVMLMLPNISAGVH